MIKFIEGNKFTFLVLLGSGIFIRFLMLWLVDYRLDAGDAANYLVASKNILNYGIFSGGEGLVIQPDFYRPPGYPFFLSLIFRHFDESILAVRLIQIIISIFTALLVAAIALKLIPNSAIWVFGLMMLSPFEAVYSGAVLSETVTAFLITLLVANLILIQGLKKWFCAGFLLGVLSLTRDIYIVLPIFFLLFFIFFGAENKKSRMLSLLAFLTIFFLTLSPWAVRNFQISESFTPVSEGRLGYSLWTGTWATDPHWSKGVIPNFPDKAFRSSEEKAEIIEAYKNFDLKADQLFTQVAKERIQENPFLVIKAYILRQPYLWMGTRFDIFELNKEFLEVGSLPWKGLKIIFYGINTLFLMLAIYGASFLLTKSLSFWPLAIPIFYTAAVYMPLNSFENRYSQPVYPLLLFFAGYGLSHLFHRAFNRTNT